MTQRLFVALAASLLVGCVGAQTFTSARTLDQGKTEVTLAANVIPTYTGSYYGTLPLPSASVQVRHGISDRVEIGGGVGRLGVASGTLKLGLLRPERADGGVSLSVGPEVSVSPIAIHDGGAPANVSATMPLLLGLHLGGGHELTAAPQVRWTFDGGHGVSAGATLGFALRLTEQFLLTPELGLLVPVSPVDRDNAYHLSFGVGFTWGR